MGHKTWAGGVVGALLFAAPALADEGSSVEARLSRVEAALTERSTPSAREIGSAVDAYLATAKADARLVGGPEGSVGYDGGFWLRGGSFLLKINVTIQTRFEAWRWEDEDVEPVPGGDLSGFSLPRVTLKFSGDATCDVHYYAEFEFGHHGLLSGNEDSLNTLTNYYFDSNGGFDNHALGQDVGVCREAWIEYESNPMLALRMGLVKLPTTRQLMTPPEMQQFVDISLASAFVGVHVPGYSDRNRDYGILIHGQVGCDGEWSYMVSVTNGDGPITRNVLDGSTDDNLAYGARVNWDIKGHIGYEEGALRQHECEWVASVGAWGYIYHDTLNDKPHTRLTTRTLWGVDAAAGWGSWSATAAYTRTKLDESDLFPGTVDGWSWLAQVGYLFPGTAIEIAARASQYEDKTSGGGSTFGAREWAAGVTYYVDGHADKLTLDAAYVEDAADGNVLGDVYAGYNATLRTDSLGSHHGNAIMIRFQWQLAL
jgi:hypothetical protein